MSENLSCSTAMLITLRLRSYASDRCRIFKDWNAPRGYHKMPLTISDQDETESAGGPRFRVIVYLPAFLERLLGRLRRFLGGA